MANKNTAWFIFIAVVAAYLLIPGVKTGVNGLFSGIGGGAAPATGGTATTGGTTAPEICIYDGTTMTIGPMQKRYDPSTSVASEYARIYISGVDNGYKADSSTLAVTNGDTVKIGYALNSSTYYAAIDEFTVPCKATIATASSVVASDKKPAELYQQNAGLTATVNNEDGSVNSGSAKQAVGVGDNDIEVSVSLKGTFEDGWSPYGNLIASCQFNGTTYDKITLGTYAKVSCPSVKTDPLTATDNEKLCFQMPGMDGVANKKLDFTTIIDADDILNPSTNIVCTVFDQDYFANTKSGVIEGPAVEDDQNNNVGLTSDLSFTIYVS